MKALLLGLALLSCTLGMVWLALAIDVHWRQVRGNDQTASPRTVHALRAMGFGALGLSLLICLCADHASMAALVWVMSLAGSALIVAFTLSWRPCWLGPLVSWARHEGRDGSDVHRPG